MRAALVANHRVNFIDDQRASGLEHATTAITGKQDVERFWSSNNYVRRTLDHRRPFVSWSITCAHKRSDVDFIEPECFQFFLYAGERLLEVLLNIVRKRL